MAEMEDSTVVECGGACMVNVRPCFDHQNKYLFCSSDSNVHIFSVDTGDHVRSLPHRSDMVGVAVDEEDPSQILTCSANGVIARWDYETGEKSQEWTSLEGTQVRVFLVPKQSMGVWFIIVGVGKDTQLYAVSRTKKGISKRLVTSVPSDIAKVSIHNKGHFVAYGSGRKLWIKNVTEDDSPARSLSGSGEDITLVACHPVKDTVAVGDKLGRIWVWHKVLGHRAVYTIYHWHHLPINDVAFSNEGTTMYSCGDEMVVVRWSFQSSSKEETKDFLPRVGARIRFLVTSPDSSMLAASLEDNSIVVASSQLKYQTAIRGFLRNVEHPSRKSRKENEDEHKLNFPVGLVLDNSGCGSEKTKCVVITNGRPGYLQFYDAEQRKQKMTLDVIGKNQPPPEREKQLSYFEVMQVAVCPQWLATIDHRPDSQYSDETNLKFWNYDPDTESFKLHTWIDHPHSDHISSLFFRAPQDGTSDGYSLISTGLDGKFKIWEISKDKHIYKTSEFWNCERVGYYRSQPATCGDVSSDGNLGIGFGPTLTLWNFDEHRMVFARTVLPEDTVIRKLQFGMASGESNLVAILSEQSLSVWDLSSELCMWRITTAPQVVCKDSASGLFAAFFDSKICLFRLSSPEPVFAMSSDHFDRAVAATFGNGREDAVPPLYFIGDNQRLFCLGKPNGAEENDTQVNTSLIAAKTPFARLLAESKTTKRNKAPAGPNVTYEANLQLLSGPAHTLPTVSVIGPKFAESCLLKKGAVQEEEDENSVCPDLTTEMTLDYLKSLYS